MGTFISKVNLYKNVPLYRGKNENIMFSSKSERDSQFSTKLFKSYENLSYIRNEYIFIPDVADIIENCNYLSFNNYDKEIYAFITKIEYENEGNSKVYYEIDYFQSFIYECAFLPSMVEREHVIDDTIGKHILDENLPLGEFKYDEIQVDMSQLTNTFYLVASLYDVDSNNNYGGIYNGIPSGLYYYVCRTFNALKSLVYTLTSAHGENAVHFACIIPQIAVKHMVDTGSINGDIYPKVTEKNNANTYSFNVDVSRETIDGYTPHNKKCFIYPYSSLYMTNNEGQSNELLWENFSTGDKFMLVASIGGDTQVLCVPRNYKNAGVNIDESISLTNYPKIALSIDTFDYWLTANVPALISNVGSSTIGGAIHGGMAGAVTGAVASGTNIGVEYYQHKLSPLKACGNTVTSVNVSGNLKKFSFYHKHITYDYIRRIDDYFTMFGYKIDMIKTPNLNSRNMNYVKTNGCNISGEVPPEGIEKIKQMFDEGVSIWHSFNIGVYY